MKKIGAFLLGIAFFSLSFANASNCLKVEFDNGDSLCVEVEKNGSRYTPSVTKRNLSSNPSLRCEILLPNDVLKEIGACNESFTYSSSRSEKVTLYVRYNNTYYTIVDSYFDFDDGVWWDRFDDDDDDDDDDDELTVKTSDTTLDEWDWTNMKISTDSSYRGKIEFTIKYDGDTISNSKFDTYFSDYDDIAKDGYRMTASDGGTKKISKFLKFKKDGTYQIIAEDNNGETSSVKIKVSDSDDDDDDDDNNDTLSITTSDSTVETDEWIDVTIETDRDYTNKVKFKWYYKSSDSSSRKEISSTNSSYFSDYSTEWSNGYYRMTSSDKGEVTFNKFVKFHKEWKYKIEVEDNDNNSDSVTFTVDDDDDDDGDEDFEITFDPSSPWVEKWVDVTVKHDKNYYGSIKVSDVEYRTDSDSKWKSISKTSTSYFDDYSNSWKNGFTVYSSDNGKWEEENFIKFAEEWQYRITFMDKNSNTSEKVVTVWKTSSDDSKSSVDGFTKKEYNNVVAISAIWDTVVSDVKRASSTLRYDNYWLSWANQIKDNLKDVINDKSKREYDDFDELRKDILNWITYAQRNK